MESRRRRPLVCPRCPSWQSVRDLVDSGIASRDGGRRLGPRVLQHFSISSDRSRFEGYPRPHSFHVLFFVFCRFFQLTAVRSNLVATCSFLTDFQRHGNEKGVQFSRCATPLIHRHKILETEGMVTTRTAYKSCRFFIASGRTILLWLS